MILADIKKLSDKELLEERDRLNARLKYDFFTSSGLYDATATVIKELELEMLQRQEAGPPWNDDPLEP